MTLPKTQSEIINFFKANFTELKADKARMAEATSGDIPDSAWRELSKVFVHNKYVTPELIKKSPVDFAKASIELGFNPGVQGIIDYCDICNNSKLDKAIAELISAFPSNKYDASIIKTVINLAQGDDSGKLVLKQTMSALVKCSGNLLIVLDDLKKSDLNLFIDVFMGLDPKEIEKVESLIDKEIFSEYISDNDPLPVLKFFIKNDVLHLDSPTADDIYSHLKATKKEDKATDSEYIFLVKHLPTKSQVKYRPCLEEEAFHNSLRFTGVPDSSRHFFYSFAEGLSSANAEKAFNYVLENKFYNTNRKTWRTVRVDETILYPILSSGTDLEMSNLIKNNSKAFTDYVKNNPALTPSKVADALSSDRMLTVQAVHDCLGTSFRKHIRSVFKVATVSEELDSKISISEKHDRIFKSMQNADSTLFMKLLESYEPKKNDNIEQFEAFMARHSQDTYRSKYKYESIALEFLSMVNEEYVKIMFDGDSAFLRFRDGYKHINFNSLSAETCLIGLNSQLLTAEWALELCNEKLSFAKSLELDEFSHIGDESLKVCNIDKELAEIVVKKITGIKKKNGEPTDKIDLSDRLKKQVCLLLDKKEAIENLEVDLVYGEDSKLSFKGKEKFNIDDYREKIKKISSYSVDSLVDILLKSKMAGANELLLEIAEALTAASAEKFKTLFPNATVRNSDLKKLGVRILSEKSDKAVDPAKLIKQNSNISNLKDLLGEGWLTKLCTIEKKGLRIIADIKLSSDEVCELAKNFSVKMPDFRIILKAKGRSKEDTHLLKKYLECKIEIGGVSLELDFDVKEFSEYIEEIKEIYNLCKTNNVKCNTTTDAFFFSLVTGDFTKLETVNEHNIAGMIDSELDFLSAIKLAHPDIRSKRVALMIASNDNFEDIAIQENLIFENVEVFLGVWSFRNISKNKLDKLKTIGIFVYEESEEKKVLANRIIFDDSENIKEFDPISLKGFTVSEIITLIKKMSSKNPKYKKLLTQDLSGNNYVLVPPSLIDKALITTSNLKEVLGAGIPSDLTKEQKESLDELFTFRAGEVRIACSNYRDYLESMGHKSTKFSEILAFYEDGSGGLTYLGEFFSNNKVSIDGDNMKLLLKSVLKDISREEAIKLLGNDGNFESYHVVDAAQSVDSVKESLNKIFAIIGNADLNSSIVFEAMAGNVAANEKLDSCTVGGGRGATILRGLSDLIKTQTVKVSISRKRARAGEDINLGESIHDIMGELARDSELIFKNEREKERLTIKTGFYGLNGYFSKKDNVIKSKHGAKYKLYFPKDLKEVKSIGKAGNWCTSYNETYFNDTISGKAVLFNLIKEGEDEVEAQGYVEKRGNKYVISQLSRASNDSCSSEFDLEEIVEIIVDGIKKDENLRGRYGYEKE